MEKEKMEKIHEQTYFNKELFENDIECVCIDCGRKFNSNEIERYVMPETALCPYCDIDSVIPLMWEEKELTDDEINELCKYWFGPTGKETSNHLSNKINNDRL